MPRLLKASSYYRSYLDWFYARNPLLRTAPYAVQHDALMRDRFGWSDAWKVHLEATGRFEVEELVVNAEPLQRQWARENGVSFREESWLTDIFLAQFGRAKPDLVFAHAAEIALSVGPELKSRAGRPLCVMVNDGVAAHDPRLARGVDLIVTPVVRSLAYYRDQGLKAVYMAHGFDSRVLTGLPAGLPADLGFIGSLDIGTGHQKRAVTLRALAAAVPLGLWLGNVVPSNWDILRLAASHLRRGRLGPLARLPQSALALCKLRPGNQGAIYGREMFAQLAATKVSVNVHLDAAINQAGNVRLYEATGTGSCLLTDWKDNMAELYEPDREVVVFRSAAEAVDKARQLLADEKLRAGIALQGQRRCLRSHELRDRILEVGEQIQRAVQTS